MDNIRKDLTPDPNQESGPWRSSHVWVSPHNFADEILESRKAPAKVIVHDSTLRDGEQAPGVSFDTQDKLKIARLLDEVGVQYVEAGFPPVSEQDRKSIKAICQAGLKARITCLSRAMQKDLDMAEECGVWGVVLEVPVGYPRLQYQFGWSEQKLFDRVMESVVYAKQEKGLAVVLFMIDTARARIRFIEKLLKEAEGTGCLDRVAVVDTVGAMVPEAAAFMTRQVRSWISVPLEMHCHNDLGLGTANTLAGLMAGAEIASATVSGLGQRAGNAPTEEVIMALKVAYGVPCNLNTNKLIELSKLVQELTGYHHPAYRSIVGDNVFRWAAGIPVAGLLKEPRTVEAFGPELLGKEHQIELGKKAGKANITWKIGKLGLPSLPDEQVLVLVDLVKEKATEIKGVLNNEQFIELYERFT
jgi:methanogen homocitrate synthase